MADGFKPIDGARHYLDPNSPEARASREGENAPDVQPKPFADPAEPSLGAPAARPAARPAAPAETAPQDDAPKLRVDPRTAMFKRIGERTPRSTEGAPLNIDAASIPEGVGFEGDDQISDDAAPARTPIPPAVQSQNPPVGNPADRGNAPQGYNLKVNGNHFSVSREDALRYAGLSEEEARDLPDVSIVKAAQINLAAEMNLTDAKAQRRSAPPAAHLADDHIGTDQRANGSQPNQPLAASQPQEAELIEQIQLGDPEQALKAFDELSRRRQQQNTIVQRAADVQRGIQTDIESFAESNADIAGDPFLADAHRTALVRGAVEELRRVVPHMVSDALVPQLTTNPQLALQCYTAAMADGFKVKKPIDLLKDAADGVRERFGGKREQRDPAPAPTPLQTRIEAKRALVQQPTRSQFEAPSTQPAQQMSRAQKASAAIAQMRQSRHQG